MNSSETQFHNFPGEARKIWKILAEISCFSGENRTQYASNTKQERQLLSSRIRLTLIEQTCILIHWIPPSTLTFTLRLIIIIYVSNSSMVEYTRHGSFTKSRLPTRRRKMSISHPDHCQSQTGWPPYVELRKTRAKLKRGYLIYKGYCWGNKVDCFGNNLVHLNRQHLTQIFKTLHYTTVYFLQYQNKLQWKTRTRLYVPLCQPRCLSSPCPARQIKIVMFLVNYAVMSMESCVAGKACQDLPQNQYTHVRMFILWNEYHTQNN